MGDTTEISWADKSYNPWIGCTKITPACDFCYAAEEQDHRYHRVDWGGPGKGEGTRHRTAEATRRRPFTWERDAIRTGEHPLVFSLSLGDFADFAVETRWQVDLFETIRATPHLYYLLLTKRPMNVLPIMLGMKGRSPAGEWPRNAALGATCEDRERLMGNVPHLLAAQARLDIPLLFVSYGPALEPIADLAEPAMAAPGKPGVSWWVCEGESKQGKGHVPRESAPNWFRDLQAACHNTGALFHMKQMTDRRPIPTDLQERARPDVSAYCAV